jgi:hypothetical protein
MKAKMNIKRVLILALLIMVSDLSAAKAQEESNSPFNLGADFVSRYVYRFLVKNW